MSLKREVNRIQLLSRYVLLSRLIHALLCVPDVGEREMEQVRMDIDEQALSLYDGLV